MPVHILLTLLLFVIDVSKARHYVVDGQKGLDTNTGHNPHQAFKTIQRCVEALSGPGDECHVRQGRYHEIVQINGLHANAEMPIKIVGYQDERPIWDGTVLLKPKKWDFETL